MRVDLASLDPKSPLAVRIRNAIAREMPSAAPNLTAGVDRGVEGYSGQKSRSRTRGQICPPGVDPVKAPEWASEEDLHKAIVGMIAANASPDVIVFHVPNGGKRGKAEAGRLRGMGTLAGVPDLIVLADGRAYGLEIKTDSGRMSPAQKAMARRFADAGIPYEVARSVEGARSHLRRWGKIP